MKKNNSETPAAPTPLWHSSWAFVLFLFIATLTVYLPAWRPASASAPLVEKPGFILDDDILCVGNQLVKAPYGWYQLWITTKTPDYFPIMSDTFWLEWRLWKMNPSGYRVVNVLLHVLNAILLWRILLRLIPRYTSAAKIAAVLFALHPVNVATVAWIAELKNTLSLFFFLLALLGYLVFDEGHKQRWYWFSLAAFLLALLSKIEAAPMPFVLLGIAWWRRDRIRWVDIWQTVPFFAAALFLGLLSIWFQTHVAIAREVVRTDNFWARLAGAGWAVWFYFYKSILPINLIPIYPRWHIDVMNPLSYLPLVLLMAAFFVFWSFRRSWGKPLLFGLGYSVLMLFPVLGFFNIYFFRYSLIADHWQYFSIIGPIALVSVALVKFSAFLPLNRFFKLLSGCALFVIIGILTWYQAAVYLNSETLWTKTLAKNPDCFAAHNDIGVMLYRRGSVDDAMSQFQKALKINPQYEEAYYNLGIALMDKGDTNQALDQYQKALQIDPEYASVQNNLGTALFEKGDLAGAIFHLQWALQINPNNAEAEDNLGSAFLQRDAVDQAIVHFQKALHLNPDDAQFHNNLGNALLHTGDTDGAIAQFKQSLQLSPSNAPALYNLGNIMLQMGNVDDAIVDYKRALQSKPDYADAENNLGSALLQKGEVDEAILHLQEAFQLEPNDPQINNNFGSALLQRGSVDEAITHFQTALQLNPNYANAHYNLGNTLLQKFNISEAIAEYEKALQSNPNDVRTLNNLAWVLATCQQPSLRNGSKAVELAELANQLTQNDNPSILNTLAAAYAEAGQFPEAVDTAKRALQLAQVQSNQALIDAIKSELKLYQAGTSSTDSEQRH